MCIWTQGARERVHQAKSKYTMHECDRLESTCVGTYVFWTHLYLSLCRCIWLMHGTHVGAGAAILVACPAYISDCLHMGASTSPELGLAWPGQERLSDPWERVGQDSRCPGPGWSSRRCWSSPRTQAPQWHGLHGALWPGIVSAPPPHWAPRAESPMPHLLSVGSRRQCQCRGVDPGKQIWWKGIGVSWGNSGLRASGLPADSLYPMHLAATPLNSYSTNKDPWATCLDQKAANIPFSKLAFPILLKK